MSLEIAAGFGTDAGRVGLGALGTFARTVGGGGTETGTETGAGITAARGKSAGAGEGASCGLDSSVSATATGGAACAGSPGKVTTLLSTGSELRSTGGGVLSKFVERKLSAARPARVNAVAAAMIRIHMIRLVPI